MEKSQVTWLRSSSMFSSLKRRRHYPNLCLLVLTQEAFFVTFQITQSNKVSAWAQVLLLITFLPPTPSLSLSPPLPSWFSMAKADIMELLVPRCTSRYESRYLMSWSWCEETMLQPCLEQLTLQQGATLTPVLLLPFTRHHSWDVRWNSGSGALWESPWSCTLEGDQELSEPTAHCIIYTAWDTSNE